MSLFASRTHYAVWSCSEWQQTLMTTAPFSLSCCPSPALRLMEARQLNTSQSILFWTINLQNWAFIALENGARGIVFENRAYSWYWIVSICRIIASNLHNTQKPVSYVLCFPCMDIWDKDRIWKCMCVSKLQVVMICSIVWLCRCINKYVTVSHECVYEQISLLYICVGTRHATHCPHFRNVSTV